MSTGQPAPPMGPENHTSRTCSRQMGFENGHEVLCGKPAVEHIFYRWDDAGLDHGFACAEHWDEYKARWGCAFHHEINAACGMPGSRARLGEPCFIDDLPVSEPLRAVAEVALTVGQEQGPNA